MEDELMPTVYVVFLGCSNFHLIFFKPINPMLFNLNKIDSHVVFNVKCYKSPSLQKTLYIGQLCQV